jgi:hypothetical protein
MPDCQIIHDDTLAAGDKIMIRWKMTGTAIRELIGISPSNLRTVIIGFDLFRISNQSKIIEMWQQFTNGDVATDLNVYQNHGCYFFRAIGRLKLNAAPLPFELFSAHILPP